VGISESKKQHDVHCKAGDQNQLPHFKNNVFLGQRKARTVERSLMKSPITPHLERGSINVLSTSFVYLTGTDRQGICNCQNYEVSIHILS
jgi:hypothetical protein